MNESTNLFESIFVTNIQPIVVMDDLGIVRQYNSAAEKLFQYTALEIIGKHVKKLMPLMYNKKHFPPAIEAGREMQAQTKDGSVVDIFLSLSEVKIYGHVFFAAVISDITHTKKLREQNQKLIDFNLSIVKEIEGIGNYRDFIYNILSTFSKFFDFEVGHFYEYNPTEKHLKSSNLFFKSSPRKYNAFIEITKKTNFKKGIGLPGTAWKKGTIVYHPDITTSKKLSREKLSKKPLNLAGGLALPIAIIMNYLV